MKFPSGVIPELPRIKILDIGAMAIGTENPFAGLLEAGPCEVVGFEPNQAEHAKLVAAKKRDHVFLPYFVGDGLKRIFYECNFAMTSSLFEPNTALLEKFQNLANLTIPMRTTEVQTTRLDDVPEAQGADFMKIDVQGAEVLVFSGARQTLRDILLIQTEVCFVPLYKEQPLFADIDAHLRGSGFVFHRFTHTMGRTFAPLVVNNDVNAAMSQVLWGDAVYVRDFMKLDQLTPVQLIKLAVMLHVNYGSADLAAQALAAHDRLQGTQFFPQYIKRLVTPAAGAPGSPAPP